MTNEDILTNEQCCKWLALFECLHLVSKNAEKRGYDTVKMIDKLKPNIIQNFIDERYPEIEENIRLGRTEKDDGFLYEFLYGEN